MIDHRGDIASSEDGGMGGRLQGVVDLDEPGVIAARPDSPSHAGAPAAVTQRISSKSMVGQRLTRSRRKPFRRFRAGVDVHAARRQNSLGGGAPALKFGRMVGPGDQLKLEIVGPLALFGAAW